MIKITTTCGTTRHTMKQELPLLKNIIMLFLFFLFIDIATSAEFKGAFIPLGVNAHIIEINGDKSTNTIITPSRRRRSLFTRNHKRQNTQTSVSASLNPTLTSKNDIISTSLAHDRKTKRRKEDLTYEGSAQTGSFVESENTNEEAAASENDCTDGYIPRLRLQYLIKTTRAHFADKSIIPLRKKREKSQQVVNLVDINWLKTHEEVIHERVTNLKNAIKKWNEYRMPLLVDRKSGAILDGHHRYHVGRQLRLTRLPVVLVDYLEDDTIDVDVWPECGLDCLSKEDVINMSLSDSVYPPKTSKHGFVAEMKPINIPLSHLIN